MKLLTSPTILVAMMSETDESQLIAQIHSSDAEALARFLDLKQRALIGYIDRQLGPGLKKKIGPKGYALPFDIHRNLLSF